MAQIIRVVRVMDLKVQIGPEGQKELVLKPRIAREHQENFDINYDSDGHKFLVAREW